ncbi:MAG: RNA-binding protein [Candidatus Micrarchaeota archaeon]
MTSVISTVKAEYVKELSLTGKRVDQRTLMQMRNVRLETGVLKNAEGSCLAHFGDTKVLVGVKLDLVTPFSDRPDEGTLSFNSEFSTLAHPEFESGPPNEMSIELARVVDRGIRSAEAVNLKELGTVRTADGVKCLGLYIDIYPLDHNGNLTDAAALAAMAALATTTVPSLEGNKLVRDGSGTPLKLQRLATTCSFEFVGDKVLLDATDEEEAASLGRLTIGVTDDDKLCSGQKSGRNGIKPEKLAELAGIALEKGRELLKLIPSR